MSETRGPGFYQPGIRPKKEKKQTPYVISPYLSAGLSFGLSNGQISGTPTEALAATNFTITTYSGSYSASTTISIEVTGTPAVGPTPTNNYVISNAPRIAGITNDSLLTANANNKTNLQTGIQYVDGLGRPIQTVQQQASPLGYDMVAPQAYDQYGREVTKYLPYSPETGQYGNYRPNAVSTDQNAFYTSPPSGSNVTAITDPYAQTAFDNSPLNRTVEQGAPGVPWQLTGVSGGGHTVKMVYTLNNGTSFSTDSVNGRQASMYYTTINSDFSQTLHANGYYAAGALTVTIAEDENWVSGRAGTVEEYKDIDGHVVLKRQYNYTSADQVLSTYYVYDDMGRLAFVLPPASGADGDGTMSTATLNNLCYQYRYDERGRPEAKRLPGKGWEYTVYNIMDQPVATQDSLQGIAKQWIFTKYDDRQRVVMTGIWNNGGTSISRSSLQSTLNGISTNLWESATTTGNGYTNVAWPTTNVTTTLSINYYDGYTMPGLPSAYTAPTGADLSTRGELTGTQTNVLSTSNMLWTGHYYDYWGRSLEGYAQHYLNGTLNSSNYDAITSTYDFTNAPTTVTRKHWTSASTSYPLVTVYNKYIYDWVDRKQKTWEQITNKNLTPDTLRLVSNTVYNEIGQLVTKKLHSKDSVSFMQAISYGYNERGWLYQASAPLFNMVLYYNTNSGNKAYNGNIMYQYWGVPGNLSNHYTYTYDKLNRLKSGITSADNYQESGITYDTQGNLTALNRYSAGTQIDQLTYYYNSKNQQDSIRDFNSSNSGLVSGLTKYTWDGNGNMLSATNAANTAQNKSITYNILNLPNIVTVPNGTDTYTYDAAGTKLRMVSVISGATKNTDYIGGIQYNGSGSADTLSFIQTEEGKAVHNGTTYDYQYYLGDNLGNTRITFNTKNGIAKVVQQDDYYPFGLEINRIPPHDAKNEYLYNKKELQEDFTEYDYGARFYDPVIGRWNTIDPMAEVSRRWSPYNYVENNPITLTDLDGMMTDAEVAEVQQEEQSNYEASSALNGQPGGHQGGSSAAVDAEAIKAEQLAKNPNYSVNENGQLVKNTLDIISFLGKLASIPALVLLPQPMNDENGHQPTDAEQNDSDDREDLANAQNPVAIGATTTHDEPKRKYLTYIKARVNSDGTRIIYSGRTSGNINETDAQILKERDATHHMKGFGPAVLDRSSTDRFAIRGREQQLIDHFGGAQSDNGTSGNAIRGVYKFNPLGIVYHNAANIEFGELHKFTGY